MKQNKRIMNTETLIKIREWEAERDRNLRIHCPLVAAKFQRWIDKIKMSAQGYLYLQISPHRHGRINNVMMSP